MNNHSYLNGRVMKGRLIVAKSSSSLEADPINTKSLSTSLQDITTLIILYAGNRYE